MKRLSKLISVGAAAALVTVTVPLLGGTPVWASLQQASQSVIESLQRQPAVQLELAATKQVIETDDQGQTKETWQPLSGEKAVVQPGDQLRYHLSGENTSDRSLKNLVVTQPIPAQTIYVLGSAEVGDNAGTAITYSIDNGETFVEEPMVEVTQPNGDIVLEPAPADAYTHIRWDFGDQVQPEVSLTASYDVTVR
ncbi:DUF11 domain-containing protein [Nodosilinea sp. P-1105]|uniref:DUF11 domain-containing protein n=1 Tax=Nodosilinea sp. P-1105 TaxID=2546229 RepID=UPI00146E1D19|nr:DUF11 domain-containing protein [Nodosilinea sp. P-1105]NMF81763.1 DUF11 domain-containing protein [Nodosilinea sp. P-1105]